VTTVRQRPAPSNDFGPYAATRTVDGKVTFCDEVLVARLAGGLLRLQWLGATVEGLVRRMARPLAGGSRRAPAGSTRGSLPCDFETACSPQGYRSTAS
jgi:hypothetical protein